MTGSGFSGIVLLCDEKGLILKVIHDDIGLIQTNPVGKLFAHFVDAESLAKSLDFLLEIKTKKLAFNCPISLKTGQSLIKLGFTGALLDEKLFIIGQGNSSETIEFVDWLQQINNEQANEIRHLYKKATKTSANSQTSDATVFDELSRLNNELINLQRELSKKNMELEKLNNLKTKFLGMASHDLRNPLAVILSYSEFLIDETQDKLSPEHQEFLKIISSSSQFMSSLIEDLLDITRIESGKLELDLSHSDIVELAEKNIQLNNILAAKKGMKIKLNCTDKSIHLIIDSRKIEQVFNNLLSNAIKFSNRDSEIKVAITKKGQSVLIVFKDNGMGVNPEEMENIFTPFGKAGKKGTDGEKSTGLGLSIVKKIIEGHQGTIIVESEIGKGTGFLVELPLNL